ncbi:MULTISPECIES: recombinase family protein [unclassified Butyrivibrio]|uniref:recombinase family protein n=1 Tax=unclassified Butyrivibrio TaxID=2639466 RepID=UPI0008770DCB|nr:MULTISPECIES: recombinase family protein [unclassified Butyrivibrio]SCY14566.1 Site-specific DNA recombinase [Butyrivibrio sp. INlla14]SDB52070.1 Site-specific DNA recombinase [Butyrivibrio sp. INlla16]
MNTSEERSSTIEQQKEKIRNRYKGVAPELIKVVPANEEASIFDENVKLRVAVYARVSTGDPRQTSSYELQKNHYEDFVMQHPNWTLVKIYADEGISGTSLKHRDAFIEMIEDCKKGLIDLIVVKSVSRFARNTVDCVGQVRELAALNPPVGVYFEVEHIYTRRDDSEMPLSFAATMAQEESHNKSTSMNTSIEMRFKHGIFLTPKLLGYDHDEDGNLIINEEEAKIVRLIFFMYLYGISTTKIAQTLTDLGYKTKIGNTQWSTSSIMEILQNERHCGDIISRKTYTPNYLDHKSKKNVNNRNQYIQEDHHESIVSRDDFEAVQQMIRNVRYGGKGFLPELRVIDSGTLKGFVHVNPIWAGFKADDYLDASLSVFEDDEQNSSPKSHKGANGEFDLRGYEVARSQFFSTAKQISVTFSKKNIQFTMEAIKKLGTDYVEFLINPAEKLFVVHSVKKDDKHALKWAKDAPSGKVARGICGAAFIPTLFEIFGWNTDCRYRIVGTYIKKDDGAVLLFDMNENEMIIPKGVPLQVDSDNETDIPESDLTEHDSSIIAYPEAWITSFGSSYYRFKYNTLLFSDMSELDSENAGYLYSNLAPLNITDRDSIKEALKEVINIPEEVNDE